MRKGKIGSYLFICYMLFHVTFVFSAPKNTFIEYKFAQTRELVTYVQNAANLFHRLGDKAYPLFRKDTQWFSNSRYIFIYDLNGTCIFHAAEPYLETRNWLTLHDLNGKLILRDLLAITKSEPSHSGWYHYYWAEPNQILPHWKTSYVMQVKAPNGKKYMIGSGIYNMRVEKSFIKQTVGAAVRLIQREGIQKATKAFSNRAGPYIYQDIAVYVFDMDGTLIFDPSFPDSTPFPPFLPERNILDFRDWAGNQTVHEMIQQLKNKPETWIMYIWPKPEENVPAKKIAYVQRLSYHGKEYIVGSDMYLTNPIWMRY